MSVEKLNIPCGVVINRDGIGDFETEKFCNEKKIPILLKIPYDKKIAETYSMGVPFVLEMPEWKGKFREVFEKINNEMKMKNK